MLNPAHYLNLMCQQIRVLSKRFAIALGVLLVGFNLAVEAKASPSLDPMSLENASKPIPTGAELIKVMVLRAYNPVKGKPSADDIRQAWFGHRGRVYFENGKYIRGAGQQVEQNDVSVTGFFLNASGNRKLFTGDIYLMPTASLPCGGVATAEKIMKDYFTSVGVDLNQYDKLVLEYPDLCGVNLSGFGKVVELATTTRLVRVHELGHSFGLLHSALLACTNDKRAPVSLSYGTELCKRPEYTDLLTVMGSAGPLFHAHELDQMGWLPASDVQTVAPSCKNLSQSVKVRPLYGDGDTVLPRLLKVKLDNDRNLLVSFRNRYAPFDSWAGAFSSVPTGAVVHLQQANKLTALVDPQPALTNRVFTFTPGQVLNDPESKINLSFESVDASGVQLTVSRPYPITAPSEPASLAYKLAFNGINWTVSLDWREPNDPNSIVSYYIVTQTGGGLVSDFSWNTSNTDSSRNVQRGKPAKFSVVAVDCAGRKSKPATINFPG